jgi:hypothetical protein
MDLPRRSAIALLPMFVADSFPLQRLERASGKHIQIIAEMIEIERANASTHSTADHS